MTPRLFVEGALAAGEAARLDEAQGRYLRTVLRRAEGAEVLAFNGRDGEWLCRLEAPSARALALRPLSQTRAQSLGPDLELLFAPVKRAGTDWIVEKAVELGVRGLTPVLTQRTQAEVVRAERLQAIAREAAEQCERLDVPAVRAAVPLATLLDGWDAARIVIFADEAGDAADARWGGGAGRAAPISAVIAGLRPAPAALAYLTGPEGGFAPEERRLLRSLPFVRAVSLGPRILRAETAVCSGLAVLQAVWGDWPAAGD